MIEYVLETKNDGTNKYVCPECNHTTNTFTRYIESETGNYVDVIVGKCSRPECNYHLTPQRFFRNVESGLPQQSRNPNAVHVLPEEVFLKSLQRTKSVTDLAPQNKFIQFLINNFGVDVTENLRKDYYIGTSKHWDGATVFWQINTNNEVRAGKIMLYNPDTGKRVKNPFSHIQWVHSVLKVQDFELRQCFFGEHLLVDNKKPVGIVESEKTAIIASVFFPQMVWLASGSLQGINEDKFRVLEGRNVFFYPDMNGYDKWKEKAKQLAPFAKITVSEVLLSVRDYLDGDTSGIDLADALLPHHQPTKPITSYYH